MNHFTAFRSLGVETGADEDWVTVAPATAPSPYNLTLREHTSQIHARRFLAAAQAIPSVDLVTLSGSVLVIGAVGAQWCAVWLLPQHGPVTLDDVRRAVADLRS